LPLSYTYPSTTYIYPRSLHDALPISRSANGALDRWPPYESGPGAVVRAASSATRRYLFSPNRGGAQGERTSTRGTKLMAQLLQRSEEHTSELQSHLNLVCRLLLEKKK